jgi:hypothetical protein
VASDLPREPPGPANDVGLLGGAFVGRVERVIGEDRDPQRLAVGTLSSRLATSPTTSCSTKIPGRGRRTSGQIRQRDVTIASGSRRDRPRRGLLRGGAVPLRHHGCTCVRQFPRLSDRVGRGQQDRVRRGVPVGTIKRHATGNGNANKQAVIAAVRALGFDPADDNEADALALLHWALRNGGRR